MTQKYDYFSERIKTRILLQLQKIETEIFHDIIRFQIMLQRLEAILVFYRPFFFWSFAINVLLVVFNPNIVSAIITKLILTLFVWYLVKETSSKKTLIFYKNLGLSDFKLFAALFLIDIFITIGFLLIMQEFI